MMNMEKMFDRSARNYDQTEEVRFHAQFRLLLERTQTYLRGHEVVLDYGCATGAKALELASHVKRIHGIDISSKMIELAKRKAAQRNIQNVEFTQTVIVDERFQCGSFDVIMAFNILHLLDDPRQAVQRIIALLKPGGLLIANIPCLGEKMALRDTIVFSFVGFLMNIRLVPAIQRFTFADVAQIIADDALHMLEAEQSYHKLSSYFIVAKKSTRS